MLKHARAVRGGPHCTANLIITLRLLTAITIERQSGPPDEAFRFGSTLSCGLALSLSIGAPAQTGLEAPLVDGEGVQRPV